MSNIFRALIVLLCATVLTGCIDLTTEIKIERDGSGSVTETVYTMRSMERMLQVLSDMAATLVTESEKLDAPKSRMDKRYYSERATGMGRGVRLTSLEDIKRGDGAQGVKAVYSFTDIRNLALSPEPPFFIPNLPPPAATNRRASVSFEFTPGTPAKLTAILPWAEKAAQATTPHVSRRGVEAMPQEEVAMIRHVLDGFRSHMVVCPAAPLLESNATYVDRDRQQAAAKVVVLFDVNLGEAVRNETVMDQLQVIGPVRNLAVALERYAAVTGLRVEKQPRVTLSF